MSVPLETSLQILQNTPATLHALFAQHQQHFLDRNEGRDTWSAAEVLAHLILCEQTNFMKRIELIRSDAPVKVFEPMDMSAHFDIAAGKQAEELLFQFEKLRNDNLSNLRHWNLTKEDLQLEALHPKLGPVRLCEVLSTWAAHDLTHIGQITRVLAKQYKEMVGPFITFLKQIR